METEHRSRRRHRSRKRHTNHRLKFGLFLFGLMCVAVAGGLALGAMFCDLPGGRRLALCYLIVGGLLLVARGLLEAVQALRRIRRARRVALAGSANDGFALLLVLLLMALLTGIAFQSQVFVRIALRHAQARADRAELRIAAADAAFDAIGKAGAGRDRDGMRRERDPAGPVTHAVLLPSGIAAQSVVTETNRLALPALLADAGAASSGKWLRVEARAARAGVTEEVCSVVNCAPRGRVQVLAWLEGM